MRHARLIHRALQRTLADDSGRRSPAEQQTIVNLPSPCRILLVDPFASVRLALRWALEETPDLRVVGETADGAEAVALAAALRPDLLLLELDLPTLHGLDVARAVKALFQPPAVVFLTIRSSSGWSRRAAEAGADGIIEKGCGWMPMLAAVHRAIAQTKRD